MPGLSTRRRRGPPAPIQTDLEAGDDALKRRQGVVISPLSPVLEVAAPVVANPVVSNPPPVVAPTSVSSRLTPSSTTMIPVPTTTTTTPAEVTKTIVETQSAPPPSPTVFVTVVAPAVPPKALSSPLQSQVTTTDARPLPTAGGAQQQNKGLESDSLGLLPPKGVLFLSVTGAMAGLALAALAVFVLIGRRKQRKKQVTGFLEKP